MKLDTLSVARSLLPTYRVRNVEGKPEDCEVQLRVFDASGRVLYFQKKNHPAGRQEETLDLSGASGVLWYELTTPFGVLTKKMVAGGK